MNEAGPQRQMGPRDMTPRELPGVHQAHASAHAQPPSGLSGDVRRPLQPRGHPGREAPATASPSTTWSAIPTSSPPPSRAGTPYYTNSSHLPVGYTDDIFAALDIQDELQTLYTSGTVFHAFLGEKLPDWQAAASLVRKMPRTTSCPTTRSARPTPSARTTAISPASSSPARHCGESAEVYSRITGLLPPRAELEPRQDAGV